MADFVIDRNEFYLSYEWLIAYGIRRTAIEQWSKRNISCVISVERKSFVSYLSIPEPTRKKLPSLEELKRLESKQRKERKSELLYQDILEHMQCAYTYGFIQFRQIYIDMGFSLDKVTVYARKHAVWQYFINAFYSEPGLISPVKEGVKAYNALYPGQVKYNRFCGLIKKALDEGIPSVVIKKKPSGRHKEFNEVYEYWVMQLASSGKAYSQADIHREVCAMVDELGAPYKKPGKTTIKRIYAKWMPVVQENRYGKDKTRFEKMGYVSIIKAKHANTQWQIDGWRLPFYVKGYETLYLFWVIDAHSGRVVGYKIAETENTETILDGLEDAVRNTGALPFEIVSDNHSFNQTTIAENFKAELDSMGCTWTVTDNPRYKTIVERSFKTLAALFMKKQYGYIGEGIKTRNPDGRTSQELFDKYTSGKGWLTFDQVVAIAVYCVHEYNNRMDKNGKTPIMRYEESEKPGEIRLENIETNPHFYNLFTRDMNTLLVRKGQLKFTRAGVEYEYQLPSRLAQEWNDREVRVRYIKPADGVYIYNPDTDEALGYIPLKLKAHGAKFDQTEKDVEIMSKTKSINKSVQNKNKEKLLNLQCSTLNIDPKAVELINQRNTPKNVIEELRKSSVLASEFERNGGRMQCTPDIPKYNEFINITDEGDKDKKWKAEHLFHSEEKVYVSLPDPDENDY